MATAFLSCAARLFTLCRAGNKKAAHVDGMKKAPVQTLDS
jgi:predicted nucleic acid-binding Zn finger protein